MSTKRPLTLAMSAAALGALAAATLSAGAATAVPEGVRATGR